MLIYVNFTDSSDFISISCFIESINTVKFINLSYLTVVFELIGNSSVLECALFTNPKNNILSSASLFLPA